MNIRIPTKVHLLSKDTRRMVGFAPLAILLLSAGLLAVQTNSSQQQDAASEVELARAWSDSLLHTASIEKVDILPPADSAALMHFLIKDALNDPANTSLIPPHLIDEETLWLARAIYSETKRPEEQELVAWTIRNRVETQYRGKTTYEEVVLDPYQFSAFNPDVPKANYYRNLDVDYPIERWQRALSIAYHVRHADPELRPFSRETRHFYSEQSMMGRPHPEWARDLEPIQPSRHDVDERRFRFYAGVL